jgi:hypothetical protein
MIDEESVFVTTNEAGCDNEETVNDAVFSDLVNSTTEIADENECVNTMDIGEEDVEIEEFFMKDWSLEEIKFYYELMLQEIDALHIKSLNGEEKTIENGMW